MLSYCLKCRRDTQSKNPEVVKTKNGRIMLLSNVHCVTVKEFCKEQDARGLKSNLTGIKLLAVNDLPLLNALF